MSKREPEVPRSERECGVGRRFALVPLATLILGGLVALGIYLLAFY